MSFLNFSDIEISTRTIIVMTDLDLEIYNLYDNLPIITYGPVST